MKAPSRAPRARRLASPPARSAPRRSPASSKAIPLQGVLFDVGDTLLDEERGWYGRDPLLPGVPGTLAQLARRYRLGILSNSWRTGREDMAVHFARLGIADHFQAIVVSSDLGWRKPHPLAFEAALSALGTPRERTVMVGNDLSCDVAGAKASGLRTVHLRWSPRYRWDPADDRERATETIGRFTDLPAALRRAASAPVPPRVALLDDASLFRDEDGGGPKEEGNHVV